MKKENKMIITSMDEEDLKTIIRDVITEIQVQNTKPEQDNNSLGLYKRVEVLDIFGISAPTLRAWVSNGQIPSPIRKGRRVYFRKDDILQVRRIKK